MHRRKWIIAGGCFAAVLTLASLLLALAAPGAGPSRSGSPLAQAPAGTPDAMQRRENGGVGPSALPAPRPTPTHVPTRPSSSATPVASAFASASRAYGVPTPLLEVVCYMEGRLSNQGGAPSIDNGYGCMHLISRPGHDMLDQAAHETGVSTQQLKTDIVANIRGGAAVLRDDALQVSPTHTLPTSLADWYGALLIYSGTSSTFTARLYADEAYKLLQSGFSAQADDGETITLAPQAVQPNTATAAPAQRAIAAAATPTATPTPQQQHCVNDNNVDYQGAIDCVLTPDLYDCNIISPGTSSLPCKYDDSNRPTSFNINFVVIHDIEGTAASAISYFWSPPSTTPDNQVSCHYIVDTDGKVYQIVRESDIAFQAGNFWYNEHSIGIEHAGYDATGYKWYNATEYLASANLTAWLLTRYHIPLDRNHIVAHGTVPSPALAYEPNHVDPGPYWLWDYYFTLIHQQGDQYGGVPFPTAPQPLPAGTGDTQMAGPSGAYQASIITIHPSSDQKPLGTGGKETTANFNFFYLYTKPSTHSSLIPIIGLTSDITNVMDNVEPAMSYYYVTSQPDAAGTGDTMYEVWYGENDNGSGNYYANAHLAWLAVPPKAASITFGALVKLVGSGGNPALVYGRPPAGPTDPSSNYVIGDAPSGSIFATGLTVIEDNTTNVWFEINYNHRQAWVPASEVSQYIPVYG